MSFILVPKNGPDVQVNGWNWRPTLLLISRAGLVSEEEYERMGANGCGGKVDQAKALRIAEVVQAQVGKMKTGERMRADLTVTSLPQPVDLRSDPNELYSATYDWLCRFSDFCRRSGGFDVV
jgi:hypothetical protein